MPLDLPVGGKKHKGKHKNKEKSEDKQKEAKERGRDIDKHKEKKEKRRYMPMWTNCLYRIQLSFSFYFIFNALYSYTESAKI